MSTQPALPSPKNRYACIIVLAFLSTVLIGFLITVALGQTVSPAAAAANGSHALYLSLVMSPPIPPTTPTLHLIENSDRDNRYTVAWTSAAHTLSYVLEEATNPSFTDSRVVYEGPAISWTVPDPGKTPSPSFHYHYRVKARNSHSESAWSSEASTPVFPSFVGLYARWDGEGYIRGSEYRNVGIHEELRFEALTDAETARARFRVWYDPNPYGWPTQSGNTFYHIPTGEVRSSSVPGDPSWKWGYGWRRAYGSNFGGGIGYIDRQPFTATGPHNGYTAFGQPIQYWEFKNQNEFLIHDNGDAWTQRVMPGEAILRYDAGPSHLLLHSNVKRVYFYNGQRTNDTVQYIENLTVSNSIPGGLGTLQEIPAEVEIEARYSDTSGQHNALGRGPRR